MSFQTGLSGLNASSKNLDVIGNNIANANTIGAKSARAEFTDLVASNVGAGTGAGNGNGGIGVAIATVSQQFKQGNVSLTGNNMDLAIDGNGFFQVKQIDGSTAYTRDGQFKLDSVGNILTNTGAKLLGFPTDLLGNATSVTPQPLVVPTGAPIPASATSIIAAEFNVNASSPIAASAVPPTPYTTYGTSLTAYDAQGIAIPVSLYFVKTASNSWNVYTGDPAAPTSTPVLTTMTFSSSGALTAPATPQPLVVAAVAGVHGTVNATLDLSKATQFGTNFAVTNLTQNGYTAGSLTGFNINEKGVITTRYSNGQTQARGQVLLADFRNAQGLKPLGSGTWVETNTSGQPVLGPPGVGSLGGLRSGALEDSNVDLTAELVNMMTAQRNYQANAQTIKTQDQAMQTLVNLR